MPGQSLSRINENTVRLKKKRSRYSYRRPSAKPPPRRPPARGKGDASNWQSISHVIAPSLAVAGVLIYTVFTLAYIQFYGQLGVVPSEVGFNYLTTLSSAISMLIFAGLATVAGIYFYYFIDILMNFRYRRARFRPSAIRQEFRSSVQRTDRSTSFMANFFSSAIATIIVLTLYLISMANDSAAAIQRGDRYPQAYLGPLVQQLGLTAPARVRPINKATDSPAINALSDRELLYLGQANGTAVFYDSTVHGVVRLPLGSIALTTSNCADKEFAEILCN
jgi:signal transduction histidine kinase